MEVKRQLKLVALAQIPPAHGRTPEDGERLINREGSVKRLEDYAFSGSPGITLLAMTRDKAECDCAVIVIR